MDAEEEPLLGVDGVADTESGNDDFDAVLPDPVGASASERRLVWLPGASTDVRTRVRSGIWKNSSF